MASFRTHLTVAAVVSASAATLCVQAALFALPEALMLAALGTAAGILPDVDSDHSIPTRLVFNLLSGGVAALFLIVYAGHLHLLMLLALAAASAVGVRYILYPIFAAITVHRGLFHSLPAALLLALCTASLGLYVLHWSISFSWLTACFVCGGYLVHLLLDELYSVDFMGRGLKSSFGSALTVFSFSSWLSYSLMYLAVVVGFNIVPLPTIASRLWIF